MEPFSRLIRQLGFQRLKLCLILGSLLWVILLNPMTIRSQHWEKDVSIFNFKTLANQEMNSLLDGLKPGITAYHLKKGDTLYRLSKDYFISLSELLAINRVKDPRQLAVNTKIFIPPVDYGVYNIQQYCLKSGDTLNKLLAAYNLSLWQFKRLNPSAEDIKTGNIVFLPRYPLENRYRMAGANYHRMRAVMIRPVYGMVTSRYGVRWGRMHYGVDLAAPAGTPVKAASNGKIVFSGWRGAYGLLVIIDHGQFKTYYGHLSKILTRNDQSVKQGSVIGLVGATGRAYGNHLHFEVERYGKKVNPLPYLKKY